MTRLCVPIFVDSFEQARRDVLLATESGADAIELRLDLSHDVPAVAELIRLANVPVIATVRAAGEGGECDLPDAERIELLRQFAADGARWVDLEHAAMQSDPAAVRSLGVPVIASAHDFQTRPANLYRLVREITESPAAVVKVAWSGRSVRDNLEAFDLLSSSAKPTVALCMGEAGLISRVLAKKFGAFLTFASLRKASVTAPGQPTIGELLELYRWRSVTPSTRVFGVVGSPIAHSLSPAIHNAAFDATGFDGVYVPLLVNPGYESFKAFAESFVDHPRLDLGGLSVTIPHKENALRWLRERGGEIDPLAERIGAVNTIVIERNDTIRLRGFTSDYAAIEGSLVDVFGDSRETLAGKSAAVLGAGGTGRTAVAVLRDLGVRVTIYNRSRDRAERLASEFDAQAGEWEGRDSLAADLILNTTSIGLHGSDDASPLSRDAIARSGATLAFDAIYNPDPTRFLSDASSLGLRIVGGTEMFVRQAAVQFSAWTNRSAPLEILRDTMRRVLGP